LRLAGQDATAEFDPIHPPGTLEENLPLSALLGSVDVTTLPKVATSKSSEVVPSWRPTAIAAVTADRAIPSSVAACLNLDDIENLATSKISHKAWAYYFSAGDDLYTKSHNNAVYRSILLRPRIFVDCTKCSLHTTLLQGRIKLRSPIFVSPAAQARLAHPSGEGGIAKACARFGTLQIISQNASLTPEQIVAASPETIFGFQLYVQEDLTKSESLLARLGKLEQIRFICLTLDAPVPGKREHDERRNVDSQSPSAAEVDAGSLSDDPEARALNPSGGVGNALFNGTAMDLTWTTALSWLARHTSLPIVLKGIQTHEDAYIASTYPQVSAIVLSNHGGRQLDTAPPAMHTLLEIRKYAPEVMDRIELWIDGGIKRGTDVVKALALGARAVGIGRAALYGLGAGGDEGVARVLRILGQETRTAMRLLGVETVDELGLRHVSCFMMELFSCGSWLIVECRSIRGWSREISSTGLRTWSLHSRSCRI
jgi:isopentenyl diphosphate isomerase/L-lactate dehydrogenase-like FMN-dependent dehydrogenase